MKDITTLIKSNKKSKYIKEIAKYVINEYIAGKSIDYMSVLFDLKRELSESIDFTKFHTSLESYYRDSSVDREVFDISLPTAEEGVSLDIDAIINRGNVSSSENYFGSIIDANSFDRDIANLDAFLNILSTLASVCLYENSNNNIINTPSTRAAGTSFEIDLKKINGEIKFSQGGLKKAIDLLKTIRPASIMHPNGRISPTGFNNVIYGSYNDVTSFLFSDLGSTFIGALLSKIKAIDNQTQTDFDCVSELLSAISYDAVSGANIAAYEEQVFSALRKYNVADPTRSDNEASDDATENSDNSFKNYLNATLLPATIVGTSTSEFNVNNTSSLLVNKLFKPRSAFAFSAGFSEKFAPLEFSENIDNRYYDQSNETIFPMEEYFFTTALVNDDVDFKELDNFISEYEDVFSTVSKDIIKTLSLDFEKNGNKTDDKFTVHGELNPVSYVKFYLDALAKDLESWVASDNDAGLIQLGLILNATDYESKAAIIKSMIMSNLLVEAEENEMLYAKSDEVLTRGKDPNEAYLSGNDATNKLVENTFLSHFRIINEQLIRFVRKVSGGTISSQDVTGVTHLHSVAGGVAHKMQRFNAYLGLDSHTNKPHAEFSNEKTTRLGNQRGNFKPKEENFYSANTSGIKNVWKGPTGLNLPSERRKFRPRNEASPMGIMLTSESNFVKSVMNDSIFTVDAKIKNVYKVNPNVIKSSEDVEKIRQGSINNSYFFRGHKIEDITEFTNFIEHVEKVFLPEFGGIFKTTNIQRAVVFFLWAIEFLQKCVSLTFKSGGGRNARVSIGVNNHQFQGIIAALRMQSSKNLDRQNQTSYGVANQLIQTLLRKITTRRDLILKKLAAINNNIKSIKSARTNLQNYLTGVNSPNDSSRLAFDKLKKLGFFDTTSFLYSDNMSANIAIAKHNNFTTGPDSFPLPENDDKNLEEYKLMYKVLSEPGYGLTSSEKRGKKTVLHVGIPIKTIKKLQTLAYRKTGDKAYLKSNLIAVYIHKQNDLNVYEKTYPKPYVFDMSKYIMGTYPIGDNTGNSGFKIAKHLLNYSDAWNLNSIVENTEFMMFNNKKIQSCGVGVAGIIKNRDGEVLKTYADTAEPLATSMAINHIYDYYLKLYYEATLGLDFKEESFVVNSRNLYKGAVDGQSKSLYQDIINFTLSKFPDIESDPALASTLYRFNFALKNSVFLSSERRLNSIMSVNCFDRVLSIPIAERDFLIDAEHYSIDYNDIYRSDPVITPDPRIVVPAIKLEQKAYAQPIKDYMQSLNDDTVHIAGYSVSVSLLRKW